MSDDRPLSLATDQIRRAQADKCLKPSIGGFFDEATNTVSYVVHDPATLEAAVIDSVLDFEAASGRTSNGSADRIVEYANSNNLKVKWLIETHAHADHISAAPYLQDKLGGMLAIGKDIVRVQDHDLPHQQARLLVHLLRARPVRALVRVEVEHRLDRPVLPRLQVGALREHVPEPDLEPLLHRHRKPLHSRLEQLP